VVLDNGGWQAVKEAVLRVFLKEQAKQADQSRRGSLARAGNFEQVAAAFGAHAESGGGSAGDLARRSALPRCRGKRRRRRC